jgi:hypothetical protein
MNLNLSILTALLQKLEQPYIIEDNTLIIEPTDSLLTEVLPGRQVEVNPTNPTTHLFVDIDTFDAIEYMAQIVNSLSETI